MEKRRKMKLLALLVVFLSFSAVHCDITSSTTTQANNNSSDVPGKRFVSGNTLWDNLLSECSKKTSFSCIQSNVYSYLKEQLVYPEDVNVTEGLFFRKNKVDYSKYSEEMNREQEEYLESDFGRAGTVETVIINDDFFLYCVFNIHLPSRH